MTKLNKSFMAFASGKESKDIEIKHYIGVGSFNVLCVNPNKAELKKYMNRDVDEEPVYTRVQKLEDGTEIPSIRLSFVVRTDPKKNNGIEWTTMFTLFLNNSFRYNRDNTKIQVIDKYGRTAWPTIEESKTHAIPVSSKTGNPINIDKDYRPVYVGEENLIDFLIAYLGIGNVMKFKDGKPVGLVDHPEECEAGLEKIKDYFKGDVSELRSIIALQPTNRVKLNVGVRTTDKGQYPDFFKEMPLKAGVSDYSKLNTAILERKNSNAYPNTEFSICDLKEYTVEATDFSNNTGGEMPFDAPSNDAASSPWFN